MKSGRFTPFTPARRVKSDILGRISIATGVIIKLFKVFKPVAVIKWLLFSLALAACQPAPALVTAESKDLAPAFTLPSSDGSQVSLADYAGQPVLLYFHMANG